MKDKITILDLLPVTAPGILSPEMKADMGKFLPEGAEIRHVQIERGSVTIECEYDEAFSAPEVIKLAIAEAGKGGVDGVFVNCFGDPGVRAVREVLSVPVFGGFEPAIYLALGLGDTVGIVTVLKNVVPMIRGAIARAGLEKRVTSLRTLDMPVLELADRDKLMENLYAECRRAVEGGRRQRPRNGLHRHRRRERRDDAPPRRRRLWRPRPGGRPVRRDPHRALRPHGPQPEPPDLYAPSQKITRPPAPPPPRQAKKGRSTNAAASLYARAAGEPKHICPLFPLAILRAVRYTLA